MLNIDPPNYRYCPFCGDELAEKVEEKKVRKYCKNDDWTYYPHPMTAVAAIIKRDNKVLMVKRNKVPYKGTWMFPAGFVDFGEHPEETLFREVKEETGMDVVDFELHQVEQSTDDPRAPGHFIFEYFVKAQGKIKNLDKKENADIRWFKLSENPKIGWKQHKDIFNKLKLDQESL